MDDLDDSVNFGKLHKELTSAVERDEKYQRENAAKFRAIQQKVANYDEFRDIVDASHLQPLQREDKLGGIAYQKWNVGSNPTATYNVTNTNTSTTSYQPPENTQQFNKIWKHQCKTQDEKLQFLLSIDIDDFKKFTQLECSITGEILTVLHACTDDGCYPKILYILDAIRSSKRFALQMRFLDNKQKEQVKELFHNLSQWNIRIDIQEICKMINSLKTSFHID